MTKSHKKWQISLKKFTKNDKLMKNKSQTSKNMTESYKLVKKNDKKSQASEKKKSKTC